MNPGAHEELYKTLSAQTLMPEQKSLEYPNKYEILPNPQHYTHQTPPFEDIPKSFGDSTFGTSDIFPDQTKKPMMDAAQLQSWLEKATANGFAYPHTPSVKKYPHVPLAQSIDSKPQPDFGGGQSDLAEKVTFTELKISAENYAELSEVERTFTDKVEAIVTGLSLVDLLVLQPGRNVPKSIDEYLLTLLKPCVPNGNKSSYLTGTRCIAVPHVKTQYRAEGKKPYMDTKFAIGLAYRGTLAAIAGATLNGDEDGLFVRQLQAVNTAPVLKSKFETGLHAGFYWRDTLVQAWSAVGQKLDLPNMTIQAAKNNSWIHDYAEPTHAPERRRRFIEGYDNVAERMGYTLQDSKGNWVRPVQS